MDAIALFAKLLKYIQNFLDPKKDPRVSKRRKISESTVLYDIIEKDFKDVQWPPSFL